MKLKLFVLLVAAAATLFGQVPIRDFLGEEVTWQNARMLAYGGLKGLEPGPSAVFGNPAVLGYLVRPAAELSYGLRVATELRTRIAYDEFENALGEVSIADNIHGHGIVGPLAGAYRFGSLGVGVGIAPLRDFTYQYTKEYRDDFYVKVGEDRVEQAGTLYTANLGAAYKVAEWLSVGAAGGYRFGSRSLESWQIMGAETTYTRDAGKPSGIGFAGGIIARPIPRLGIGVDYQSGGIGNWSDAESMATGVAAADLPWSGRLALSYRVPGTLPSTVFAEGRYEAWDGVDSLYSNILTVRAGVEHVMLNFVRLRYGFGVEPMQFDPTIQRADIGFGVGFDAGVAKIDFGALMTRNLLGPDNFYQPLTQTDLKIHESRSYFALTISREF